MIKLAALAVGLAFAGVAAGADFVDIYRLAKQNDPTFAAARASLEAGLEKLPQGRALLLPTPRRTTPSSGTRPPATRPPATSSTRTAGA
jgi:outer membrane protein